MLRTEQDRLFLRKAWLLSVPLVFFTAACAAEPNASQPPNYDFYFALETRDRVIKTFGGTERREIRWEILDSEIQCAAGSVILDRESNKSLPNKWWVLDRGNFSIFDEESKQYRKIANACHVRQRTLDAKLGREPQAGE